jgi:peptidoglycan hydrolase-like protein with peptidoglycan-binding domain
MDNVRNDVAKLMEGTTTTVANTIVNIVKPLASARPIIKRGMVGAIVKALQTNLIALGFLCGPDGADGDFGPNTEKAVKEFQEAHNLEVDGIVGDETYEAIENAIINTPPQPIPTPTPTPRPQYKGVKIGSSSKDENGSYRGGQAGDQTSEEVWIQDWYPGWNYVIRPKDANVAERMARECENACNNDYIGYDQWQRNSLYTEAKKVGLDLSKITTPCECDCSSLVSICCICAGMPESIFYAGGNMRTTYSLL